MRPIPATRLGDAHGLMRAIERRGRLRTDEFVTEFSLDELFPPGLENALGRMRHFVSYARSAGLVKEDRGVVELTDVGRRYIRSADEAAFYDVSPQQAEWLRRQLREKHMTDSIFHGLAIGLSLLASVPPGGQVATLDFGRAMAYLGRAGWDNENTLLIQGERHLTLLRDMELIDADRRLTPTGHQVRSELTLPIHMSLLDLANQLNPGGAAAVQAAAAAEFAGAEEEPPPPEPQVSEAPAAEPPEEDDDDGYHTAIGFGAVTPESHPPVVPRASAPPGTPTEISPGTSVPPPVSVAPPPAAESPPAFEAPGGTTRPPEPPVAPPAEPPVPPGEASVAPPAAPSPAPPLESAAPPADASVAPPAESAVAPAGPPVVLPNEAGVPAEPSVAPAGEVGVPPVAPTVAQPGESAVASETRESPEAFVAPPGEAVEAPVPPVEASAPSRVEAPVAPPAAAVAGEPAEPVAPPASVSREWLVEPDAIRLAAAESGLLLGAGVYANVAAALVAGRHVLLTGVAGSGKTTLALAVARAAARAGKADGAVLLPAGDRAAAERIVDAARRGRWAVLDELDRAGADAALGSLSAFLGGLPVTLPDGGEVAPPADWRIVATWGGEAPRGSVLRRFAVVAVGDPPADALDRALHEAAGGDGAAVAAVRELGSLGAGVLLAAARHAAARNAAAPTDPATLARELHAAYVAPSGEEAR